MKAAGAPGEETSERGHGVIEREPAMHPVNGATTLEHPWVNADATLALLSAIAAREGVPLSAAQIDQLARYRNLLLDWNARFNLTAITDPLEVERRLFLDSLRLLPAIDQFTSDQSSPRLLDIGSGGGFPGLVLKIARPALDVTLVDATGKKVRFLQEVIDRLGLDAAQAVQARAEELGRDERYRDAFDLVAARAVAPLPILLEYAMPLLRVGGVGLFPKGLDLAAELTTGSRAANLLGARIESSATLPGEETRLVVVRKAKPTPAAYPRRTGLPTRAPLGTPDGAATGRRERRRAGSSASPPMSARAVTSARDAS